MAFLLCDYMFMSIYGVLTMIFRIGCMESPTSMDCIIARIIQCISYIVLPAIQINITAFISAIRVEDCRVEPLQLKTILTKNDLKRK